MALLFTLGSVAWVVNGFYLFLPTGNAAVDLYASGYSGALVQQLLPPDKSIPTACVLSIVLSAMFLCMVGVLVWACMHYRRVSRSSIHLSKWTRRSVRCPLCSAALVGGTLFTIGAYLGIVEALNTDRVAYFGYHVRCP